MYIWLILQKDKVRWLNFSLPAFLPVWEHFANFTREKKLLQYGYIDQLRIPLYKKFLSRPGARLYTNVCIVRYIFKRQKLITFCHIITIACQKMKQIVSSLDKNKASLCQNMTIILKSCQLSNGWGKTVLTESYIYVMTLCGQDVLILDSLKR